MCCKFVEIRPNFDRTNNLRNFPKTTWAATPTIVRIKCSIRQLMFQTGSKMLRQRNLQSSILLVQSSEVSEGSHQIFEIDVGRFDCKRSQCFLETNEVTVIAWSMFSQRKTVELMKKKVQSWERLVPISEIGPNSERLVRMPYDWSEFRTIGPNSERYPNFEQLTSLTSVFSKSKKKNCRVCWIALLLRCGGSCVQSNLKNVQVLVAEKKIGVDWPRLSQFRKKIFNVKMSKSKNRRGQV
jgi:hypothetical protein